VAKKADSKHILVIRLSAMGDVAMTVPVLIALKKNHPETKITVLTKPHFEPIFKNISGIKVFRAEVNSKHKGLLGLWKLSRELKLLSITHVADLHNVLRSNILGWFLRSQSVSLRKVNKGRQEKRELVRIENKSFKPLKNTIERYQEVFIELGFTFNIGKSIFLPRQEFSNNLLHFSKEKFKKTIGVAPFATYSSKMYSLSLMEEVIRNLITDGNNRVFLFGGGVSEVKQLSILDSKFGAEVQSVAGTLSFEEELTIISNLDVMLAMDSSNGHLAANYDVPVITIWGVTHPYAGFKPFNQSLENSLLPDRKKFPMIPTSIYGNKFPKQYEEAINTIKPKTIVSKVLEILNQN